MAAVFDGKTKVGRAVADPGTDDTLPVPGSLTLAAITTPAALSGTVGAECKLVNGDRWQQISGNQTEFVSGNLMTTISGNQTHTTSGNQTVTVSGNHSETIIGNTLQTMIGAQIVSNMDVRNETRAVTHLHTHGDSFFQYTPNAQFQVHDLDMQATLMFMFEAELEHTEFAVHHLEFKGGHNYFSGIETTVSAVQSQNSPMSMKAALLALHLIAAKPGVTAFESKMGALQPKVIACAPMAGLDPNMTPLI
jgi:uncharacterized protein YcfJ